MSTQVLEIFHQASERTGEAREAYLRAACGGDASLRLEVERLLANAERANSFFADADVETIAADAPKRILLEQEGDSLGPYVLRQRIGTGGFGVVWMAEQSEPISRMVALKVIKAGMDSQQVLARFEAERQALAMMDHPNIARVLDAGATDSGRPYFAMELVRGMQITDFCRERKLDTHARLDLFRCVCRAVSHAHQKGIIHRDLKPSNVMVALHGDKAVPKVIDFGIAKATQGKLTNRTLFTRSEQFLGTPAYMSPEQAACHEWPGHRYPLGHLQSGYPAL
ncbi:MAG: serine/threonine protein kinase [Verrucomicrobiae bacterium]|nr:serine/threonine protein kinase [Verrucomicrobiae bacterium]